MALDVASEENIKTIRLEKTKKLIKNLAYNNSTKNVDLDKRMAGNADSCHIVEVKAKLDFVHSLLVGNQEVQFIAEVEAFEPTKKAEEEEVNFVNGAGFRGRGLVSSKGTKASMELVRGVASQEIMTLLPNINNLNFRRLCRAITAS